MLKIRTVSQILFILSLNIVLFHSACNGNKAEHVEEKEKEVIPLNPNGDSELALLMRRMYDEMADVRKQIVNKTPIRINLDHSEILTAHATEPEKVASAEYKAFAQMYLNTIEQLRKIEEAEAAKPIFIQLVENCMSCHEALCPGPMVKIKKLKQSIQVN